MNKIYECKECGRKESVPTNCCRGCGAYGSYKELEQQLRQQTPAEKMIEEKKSSKLYCSRCKKALRQGNNKDYHYIMKNGTSTMVSDCCKVTICDGRNF